MAMRISGLTLAIALLMSAAPGFAAENPFASASARFQVAAEDAGTSMGGRKCGGMKAEEAKCGGQKAPAKVKKDAAAGKKVREEGKCGGGKCGMKQPAEGKCGK